MAERVHSLESLLVHGLRALVDDGALSLSGRLAVFNGIVEAAQTVRRCADRSRRE
jgi:hypothetical protein